MSGRDPGLARHRSYGFHPGQHGYPAKKSCGRHPRTVVRELTDNENSLEVAGTATYQDLAVRSLRTMKAKKVEPLTAVEPARGRIDIAQFEPLYAARRKFGD